MGKETGATRDGTSVLGEDNPGTRRVGQDRMAAMEALSTMRREDVSAESGVKIPAPVLTEDPDAEKNDDVVIDPHAKQARDEAGRFAKEKADADAQAAREAARSSASPDDQLRRQMEADGRVVLEGDLSKYFVKAKVDGEEREVSLDQVHRVLQKDAAVDKRLEDASRAKKEAEAELARAKEEGDAAAIRKAEKARVDATKDLDATRTEIQAAAEALFAGDTAAATESLLKVVSTGRGNATQDTDQLVEAVTARIGQQTALKAFRKDYAEIPSNHHLAAMCDARVAELMKEGVAYEDALPQAGDYVRGEIRKLAGGLGMSEGKPGTGKPLDRTSRKETLDEPKKAAAASQATNLGGDSPAQVSSVLDEMRAGRASGQQHQQQRRTST